MVSVHNTEILNMFVTLAGFTNNEVYIVNQDGTVVTESGITGIATGEKIDEKELTQLQDGHAIDKEFHYLPSTERFLVSGRPIFNESKFEGGIYVMSSLDAIDHSISQVKRLSLISGIVALIIGAGFIFVLSRRISAPLLKMEKATREISRGDLKTRVNIHSNDEVGQLAVAINDLAIELERYRTNRQELFANISHELRTPITYLEGYANVLQEGLYHSEEEKNQYLSIIATETRRLIHLINDLFDLAKAEEEQLGMNKEAVQLSRVLKAVIVKVGLKAKEKGIQIIEDISEQDKTILGDEQRLEQIFINLLENAIQYMDEGVVHITLEEGTTDYVRVIIKDNGQGIPTSELPYIFERFHRVEKSRSRDYGGTGLGLSIVKKLVELHGGRIKVTSVVGKGTTFVLSFPSMH